jgi:hypothetical protein
MKRIWPAIPCVHNILVHAMEARGWVTGALSGGALPVSRLGRFSPDNHQIGDCVGTRACLKYFEHKKNLLHVPRIELWFLRCPACSLVTTPTDVSRLIKKNSTLNFIIIFERNWHGHLAKLKLIFIYLLLHGSPQTRQKPAEMCSKSLRFLSETN